MAPIPTPGQGGQSEYPDDFDFRAAYEEQKRSYDSLRPEYTRTTQRLSEMESSLSDHEQLIAALQDPDPEVRSSALEALGFEYDDGVGPNPQADEFEDPLEQQVRELSATVQELRDRELEADARVVEQQEFEQRDQYIVKMLEALEQEHETQFSAEEDEVIGNLAISLRDDEGVPDVVGAFERLYGQSGLVEHNRQKWIEKKQSAWRPPGGSAVSGDQRPVTKADRIAFVDQRLVED